MKKTNLDHLLQRYVTGEVTEQERIKIEAWLDVKKTGEGTDLILDEADEERLFRKITSNISNVEDVKAFRPANTGSDTSLSKRWYRIAASLLILVAASGALWLAISMESIHETVTHESGQKVILDDGTIVWLGKQSHLTYIDDDEVRQAALTGEGLFEVAKKTDKPFLIQCGDVRVKVIGTSFHLKTDAQGVKLKVITGRVNLSSAADKPGIDVAPNEMALYNSLGKIKKVPMASPEIKSLIADTEYDMEFRNTTMENVIKRIEKKFDVTIVLENAGVNRCRITADFTDHSLESTFIMIAELLEIGYTIEKGTVTITGKGCN